MVLHLLETACSRKPGKKRFGGKKSYEYTCTEYAFCLKQGVVNSISGATTGVKKACEHILKVTL